MIVVCRGRFRSFDTLSSPNNFEKHNKVTEIILSEMKRDKLLSVCVQYKSIEDWF